MFQTPLRNDSSRPRVEMSRGVALVSVLRMLSGDPTDEARNSRKTSTRLIPTDRLETKKVRLMVIASRPVV